MKYSKLGTTDIEVSKICLGTMTFGQQNTEAEGHEQMNYAFENGVNFFDTAEMYAVPGKKETQGKSEEIVGTWLKKQQRDKVIIATKVTGPSGMTWIRNPLDFKKASINAAIDGSLKRLQTDYVDLYQLHWPERPVNNFGTRNIPDNSSWQENFHEVLETLGDLIKSGKVRNVGLSNETPWGTMRYLQLAKEHNLPRMMSVQNAYSLLNRAYEIGMSEVSIREKIGLLAYSPLGFGVLTGKYHQENIPKDSRIALFPNYNRYKNPKAMEATAKYMEIAKKHNMSVTELALAFVNTRPFLTSNIIGATKMSQLKENIGSINIDLSKEIIREIEAVNAEIPNPAP
jgi:aryl-alcohol dehydrogenase-like predicted oxidoreductase